MTPDAEDFEYLAYNTAEWAATMNEAPFDWAAEIEEGRFLTKTADPIDRTKKMGYWYTQYADLMLAREFLKNEGYSFQVLLDEDLPDAPFVLITDYAANKDRKY